MPEEALQHRLEGSTLKDFLYFCREIINRGQWVGKVPLDAPAHELQPAGVRLQEMFPGVTLHTLATDHVRLG